MKNNHEISLCLNSYSLRTATYNGKPHLIAPVVLLTEGVHCGSQGCLFYPREELAKFVEAWNNRPLPVFHPEEGGIPCSANSPEIIERQSVGQLFNCLYSNGKLMGEIWVDPVKCAEVSPDTLVMLRKGAPMEVSTGLWSEDEPIGGSFKGKQYIAIARNYRPDHLALLPGPLGEGASRGACDYKSGGCGVRANCQHENKKEYIDMNEEAPMETPRFFWDADKAVQDRVRGHLISNIGVFNAEAKIRRMTAQEAVRMDRSLRGCSGSQGSCGGCGTCGDPQVISNDDGEETPLTIPLMNFGPPPEVVDNSDDDGEEEPMELPVLTFEKK